MYAAQKRTPTEGYDRVGQKLHARVTYHITVEFPGCHLDEGAVPDDNHCKLGTL